MKKSVLFSLGIFLFIAAFTGISFAREYMIDDIRIGATEFKDIKGIKIGQAELKQKLGLGGQYDSNVFLSSGDVKSDYINLINPAFLVDLPFGTADRNLFQLLYNADIGRHSNYLKQDYLNQEVGANVNLRFPSFGYFNGRDIFRSTSDRADTEFTSQVKRHENQANAALGVEMNKLAYEIGYENFVENYLDPTYNNLDYTEDIYSLTGFYQAFPKTQALLEYKYGTVDYRNDSTRKGDYDQVRVGVKGQITGKTVGIVKVGYQSRHYDTEGPSGYNGFVAEAGVTTRFSERTELTTKFLSTAMESIYSPNNYYDNNTFSIDLTQQIYSKLKFLGSIQASRNLYPEITPGVDKKRRDTIMTGNVALEYALKDWWKVRLGYEYKEDMSNIETSDYKRNLVTFMVNLMM